MSERSKITVARFDRGVVVRVEGAGTMLEGPVIHAFAERMLAAPPDAKPADVRVPDVAKTVTKTGEQPLPEASPDARMDQVVLDLSACTYIDSTFLGGLVSLFKRHVSGRPDRFAIYAPAPLRQSLFGTSRLDRVFPFVDELPLVGAERLPLEVQSTTSRDELGSYVVECHRRLAELGGAEAETYGRVAEAIAQELTVRRKQSQ